MATIIESEPEIRATRSDEPLYEVVKGQRVELPPMGVKPAHIASLLNQTLGPFARTNGLGRGEVEMLFVIDEVEDTKRRPDVAYVSYERWPRTRPVPSDAAWAVVPDLAVEVVSRFDYAEELLGKIREYFEAGVRAVWVIYPEERVVHIFDSFTTIRALTVNDDLDGGPVLPGFRLPLGTLFEVELDEAAD